MSRLLDGAEIVLVRGLLALLRRLPPATASNLCGAVARLIGPHLPVSRVAETNLRLAMPELDAESRRGVIRAAWDNLGRVVGEFPHLARLGPTASGPGWEVEGAEIAQALVAEGGRMVGFTAHFGNWEIMPRATAALGLPMGFVYRAARNPRVDALILALRREAVGIEMAMFAKGAAGGRAALAHLRQGGRLAMLVDQKLDNGIAAPFFGRAAMTTPAAAAMALRFGCKLVPFHAVRLGPARFRIVVQAPLDRPAGGAREGDVAALTAAMNATIEGWVRAAPGQWLWLHRRWEKPLYRRG